AICGAEGFGVHVLKLRHAQVRSAGNASGETRGGVWTGTPASCSIVARLDRAITFGSSGHGVRTTQRTVRPAARAASIVKSVWLIVPSPGRAATTSGRARSTARSRTL